MQCGSCHRCRPSNRRKEVDYCSLKKPGRAGTNVYATGCDRVGVEHGVTMLWEEELVEGAAETAVAEVRAETSLTVDEGERVVVGLLHAFGVATVFRTSCIGWRPMNAARLSSSTSSCRLPHGEVKEESDQIPA